MAAIEEIEPCARGGGPPTGPPIDETIFVLARGLSPENDAA
jgi:hypothetical protein